MIINMSLKMGKRILPFILAYTIETIKIKLEIQQRLTYNGDKYMAEVV